MKLVLLSFIAQELHPANIHCQTWSWAQGLFLSM